jgi:hypothetical protein
MNQPLRQRLKAIVFSDTPLSSVSTQLRQIHGEGIDREDIEASLSELRKETVDEAEEDRVLEALDLITGFCSPELRI